MDERLLSRCSWTRSRQCNESQRNTQWGCGRSRKQEEFEFAGRTIPFHFPTSRRNVAAYKQCLSEAVTYAQLSCVSISCLGSPVRNTSNHKGSGLSDYPAPHWRRNCAIHGVQLSDGHLLLASCPLALPSANEPRSCLQAPGQLGSELRERLIGASACHLVQKFVEIFGVSHLASYKFHTTERVQSVRAVNMALTNGKEFFTCAGVAEC